MTKIAFLKCRQPAIVRITNSRNVLYLSCHAGNIYYWIFSQMFPIWKRKIELPPLRNGSSSFHPNIDFSSKKEFRKYHIQINSLTRTASKHCPASRLKTGNEPAKGFCSCFAVRSYRNCDKCTDTLFFDLIRIKRFPVILVNVFEIIQS